MSRRRRLTERTLYSPLGSYARTKGFDSVQEIGWDGTKGALDLLIQLDDVRYIVEIKIGPRKKLHELMIDGLLQSYRYAREENTTNIAVVVYDVGFKDEAVEGHNHVKEISLNADADAIVLSEFWYGKETISGRDFFDKLWNRVNAKEEQKKGVRVAVDLLSGQAKEFARKLRSYFVGKKALRTLAEEIGYTYDAFFSLGNIKRTKRNETEMDLAIVDLLACVILCQIIFYVMYQRTHKELPRLPSSPLDTREFQECFDAIREIDYEPIYEIEALGKLPPSTEEILEVLGKTVVLLEPLRPDEIEHDLVGQLFSSIMPAKTRKVLAGFYSLPRASDVLARLAIRDYRKTIWDPACGSGAILVSAYKTMRDHYKRMVGGSTRDLKWMHRSFVEKQITGNDIMAFACILSGLNLASEDVAVKTDTVRIFKKNSLSLPDLVRRGIAVRSAVSFVSEEIASRHRPQRVVEDDFPVSANGQNGPSSNMIRSEIELEPVDVILMNPPFTVRTNLDKKTLEELKTLDFAKKRCGHDVDLWGYFLAMAPDLARDGGVIGAIVSMGFLKGVHTQRIRDYYLENLSIKYIVKPMGEATLSGNSRFKDIIMICEKRKPLPHEKTVVVLLSVSLEDIPEPNTRLLVRDIERLALEGGGKTEDAEVKCIDRDILLARRSNLLPLFVPESIEKTVEQILGVVESSPRLSSLRQWKFKYGIYLHANYSKALYVQRKLPNRLLRGRVMQFEDMVENGVRIKVGRGKLEGEEAEVPMDCLNHGLITATGMTYFDVSDRSDFIVRMPFNLARRVAKEYSISLEPSDIREEVGPDAKKERLAVVERYNLASKNSHHVAFYSKNPILVSNQLYPISTSSDDEAKLLCLSLNSSVSLLQICYLKSESQMKWSHILKDDWCQTKQLDPRKLTDEQKNRLLALFDEISTQPAPSLKEQLDSPSETRVRLDREVLRTIGLKTKNVEKTLPQLYAAISAMIASMDEKNY